MKKSFTGPAWFLLILGLLITIGAISSVTSYLYDMRGFGRQINLFRILFSLLYIPTLFFIEAFLYWRLRRYNTSRPASWAHCFGVLGAYLLPVLFAIPTIMHYRVSAGASSGTDGHASRYLFWVLMVLAHIFFVYVVVQSLKNRHRPSASPNSENLLDDVLF